MRCWSTVLRQHSIVYRIYAGWIGLMLMDFVVLVGLDVFGVKVVDEGSLVLIEAIKNVR